MTFAGHIEATVTIPSDVTISVTTNGGGPTTVTITSGDYFLEDFLEQLHDDLTTQRSVSGGAWTVSLSTGASGTGLVTISVSSGTYSITWTSTNLRNLLGFTSNISAQTTSTGVVIPSGFWMPDCPLSIATRLESAPRVTDLRSAKTPSGRLFSHVGNSFRRHRDIQYSHCESRRIWAIDAVTANESLERFLDDTQFGQGHAWFSPSSKVRIMAHTGDYVGESYVDGWYIKGVTSMDDVVRRVENGYDGLWSFSIPELCSDS